MAFSPIPHEVYPDIFHIDPKWLRRQGITLLLADLDNTLARYGQAAPEARVIAWKEALAAEGVELYLLSNSRKSLRVKHYAEALGVPYQGHSGKPSRSGFRQAMERMGRTSAETAMVGDQIFTDVLGARRSGVMALMVEPIELRGNPGRYLRYGLETPFRYAGKRRRERRL